MVSLPSLRKVYFEWWNGDKKNTKEHVLLAMVEFQLQGQAGCMNDVRAQRSCRKIMNALSVQGQKSDQLCAMRCVRSDFFPQGICVALHVWTDQP